MSQATTFAPSLANLTAVAWPMPWPAPVMIATLSSRRMGASSAGYFWDSRTVGVRTPGIIVDLMRCTTDFGQPEVVLWRINNIYKIKVLRT